MLDNYKSALEVCKGLYDYRGNMYIRPYEMDYLTLETIEELIEDADKYKWHNLKENPEDLPKENKVVLCMRSGVYKIFSLADDLPNSSKPIWLEDDGSYHRLDYVDCWKYIEPFEVNEDD